MDIQAFSIYKSAHTICAYYPTKKEPDIRALFSDTSKQWILPVVFNEKLILRRYLGEHSMQENKFHIKEPDSTCPRIDRKHIDLFLIPGVAFDKHGYRKGHGGGYYDRLLKNISVPLIGVCFESQLVPSISHSANDTKVDIIITETHTYDLRHHQMTS